MHARILQIAASQASRLSCFYMTFTFPRFDAMVMATKPFYFYHSALMCLPNNHDLSGCGVRKSDRACSFADNKPGMVQRLVLVQLTAVTALALALAGCGKREEVAGATGDPEVDARLVQLTKELHHTMAGRKINRNFDEFVALAHLDAPPPPPTGKKYAINEKWKVVLVDK